MLEAAIGTWIVDGVHHVGSTSVPGLDAKPIIDILVGVEDLESSRACFGALADLRYSYAPYRAEQMHWFCKPDPNRRTHHLHLVPVASRRYRDELAFRDRLRASPETAAAYAELKHRLARRFVHNLRRTRPPRGLHRGGPAGDVSRYVGPGAVEPEAATAAAERQEPLFTNAWYGRQGSLRRPGHGGSPVGTVASEVTGRTRLEGIRAEPDRHVGVFAFRFGLSKDHTGCVPFGAAIETLMCVPAR